MWKDGLTQNTLEVFERISKLDFVKDFHLCGGTGIALQLNHRFSEDLDFELLTVQGKSEKEKKMDREKIFDELKTEFGSFSKGKTMTDDHFDCTVGDGVKLSFYKPRYKVPVLNEVNILNNIKTVSLQDALGMKLYVINVRSKFRDYYDIYSLLKEGYSLKDGIQYALSFSRHDILSKNLMSKLVIKEDFDGIDAEGRYRFVDLKPKYEADPSKICAYIEAELSKVEIKKIRIDKTAYKSIGRLFYETFKKLDDDQLCSVLKQLPEYKKSLSEDDRMSFLMNLLSFVGVKVVPYEFNNGDIYELRKKKDIESLSRIDGILSEYDSFHAMNSDIMKQNEAIKSIQMFPDSSVKETLIANCNTAIESLRQRQQNLRYYQEFLRAENAKGKSVKREPLDFSEGEDGAYESKGCKIK